MLDLTFADEMVWNRYKVLNGNFRTKDIVGFLERYGLLWVDNRTVTYTAKHEFKINLQTFRPNTQFNDSVFTYACTDPKNPTWDKGDEVQFQLSKNITIFYKNPKDVVKFLHDQGYIEYYSNRDFFYIAKKFTVHGEVFNPPAKVSIDDAESIKILEEYIRAG